MGNCIRRKKSYWADGEHRGSTQMDGEIKITEEEEKLVGDAKSREVKITISKKELQQLMQKVEMQGLSLEQLLLARMVQGGGDMFVFEQPRPWKPVLQSIPEVN
ncbi:hypothetical protein V6N13_059176 [Hibiscus sabdariffa]|uniref:Uncharacterized protein n=2 Tax=Hibiscus sabdariffa TaxID=183260 RepID=A0ABR2GE36_9ROSI